jgi:2'-5' RNA ligase
MRLFTAIDLPGAIQTTLDELVARLKPLARIAWSPASNLHITTKFIGEWPDGRLDELKHALAGLGRRAPFEIQVRGVGFFPNPKNPRVFWVGIRAPEDLADLAMQTGHALAALGVALETRPYSPHLTLARIREPQPLDSLREAIQRGADLEFGSFTATRFHLYQSRPGPGGSVYTPLAEFPF